MFGKKAPCDPRCDKHSGPVSQRVRRSCTKRIDFDLKLQANRSDSELDAEEPLIASMPIGAPGYVAHTPEPSASHYDDNTAPPWSRFGNSETFGCIPRENLSSADSESDTEAAGTAGTGLGFFEPEGADDCLHATDSEPDLGPDQLDYDQSGGTDVGYTSGSEADVDTDCDMYAELDDLEYISQASTRAPSPVLEDSSNVEPPVLERTQDEPADSSHEVPNHDNGHSRQATEDDANHKDERKELPDALRAFCEWILTMSSTGDLTVEASESLLKTLNTCLIGGF